MRNHIPTSDEPQENQVVDLIGEINTGPQQADSVIGLILSDSERYPVVISTSPRANPEPLLSPEVAVDMEQDDDSAERSELPRAPVAEMLPPNPPDSPLFCCQESEAIHEPVTFEPPDHGPAASSLGPAYSDPPTEPAPSSLLPETSGAADGTADAIGERYYCPLCDKGYSRKCRVRDHFDICKYLNGNPDGLEWDADESCWPKRIAHNPADEKCPICQCVFSRPSEAKAHFVLCAEASGNPENIVFQGITTGRDTLHGEEQGEIGAFRCALCGKLSGKKSHARTHWKVCGVKRKTPARELRGRYDNMGRILPGLPEEEANTGEEPADHGEANAGERGHVKIRKYRCGLCKRKNNKRDLAVDHFQRCLRRHGMTRQDRSDLDDTGMPYGSASERLELPLEPTPRNVRINDPTRKRSHRVAFDDDATREAATANDAAAAAAEPATEPHTAKESGIAGAVSDTIGKSMTFYYHLVVRRSGGARRSEEKATMSSNVSPISLAKRIWLQRVNSATFAQLYGFS